MKRGEERREEERREEERRGERRREEERGERRRKEERRDEERRGEKNSFILAARVQFCSLSFFINVDDIMTDSRCACVWVLITNVRTHR